MMCEKCLKKFDNIIYGSGRFCSSECAHSRQFTTASKKKISKKCKGIRRTDEWKRKISQGNKGKKRTEQQIKNRIASGFKFTKERDAKISAALTGRTFSDEHRKNLRLSTIKRIREHHGKAIPNYNINACKLIDEYGEAHGYTFQHALNGGEYLIESLGYFVDGYDKKNNVVIEYYEKHHQKTQADDAKRKSEIVDKLDCEFIEIWE